MARLAIISSYNENCGNASYTHVLKKAFSEFLDVDVLPLDLFLIQHRSSMVKSAADRHIKNLAAKLADYDYVNIQFEAGLYGSTIPDVRRRIGWLIKAAPNLILTMHRVDVASQTPRQAFIASLKSRSIGPWRSQVMAKRYANLYDDIIQMVRRSSLVKNAWIKVHTRRERRAVTEIYGFKNCFDFPLAFLTPDERKEAMGRSDRDAFLRKHGFEKTDKVVGLFGYISEYKGIETALRSLSDLPDEYKLAFFGSHHPQAIRPNMPIHPYLESIVELMGEVEEEIYDEAAKAAKLKRLNGPNFRFGPIDSIPNAPGILPMAERVKFVGSLDDPEFIEALRLCDAVVLPYIEVGQSMSGVVALGVEAGAKMICANNHSFAEVKKYFGDVFISFDMGNYVELAQKIRLYSEAPVSWNYDDARDRAYEKYNIRMSVLEQLARFGFQV